MTYASTALALDAIGFWALDEVSGSAFADSSTNGQDLTLSGTADYAQPSLMDSGEGASVTIPFASYFSRAYESLHGTISSQSVVMFLRREIQPTGGLFESGQLLSDGFGCLSINLIANNIWVDVRTTTGKVGLNSGFATSQGVTYHMAVTYDSSTGDVAMYIDGVSVYSTTVTGVFVPPDTGTLLLGKTGAANIDAGLQAASWHDRALTPTEIATLYDSGIDELAAYYAAAAELDAVPVQYVELVLERCSLTSGTSPCASSAAAGSECYNTLNTIAAASCQDRANYTPAEFVYRFGQQRHIDPLVESFPCLSSVRVNAPRIKQSGGMALRSSVTVQLQSMAHHDIGLDPYVSTRTYDPEAQGDLLSKMVARNPYYAGKTLRVLDGFVGMALADFRVSEYQIDSMTRPDSQGRMTITARDPLRALDDDKVTVPPSSAGVLSSALTASTTGAVTITGASDDGYVTGVAGYVAIGDEIIEYSTCTVSAPDVSITIATRGTQFTTASAHAASDGVQWCYYTANSPAVDELEYLVTRGLASSYLDLAGTWTDAANGILAGYALTTLIPKPTGAAKLIEEILEQCPAWMWSDPYTQSIKLRAVEPYRQDTVIDGETTIIADSASAEDVEKERITEVDYYYGLQDWFNPKDEESYSRRLVSVLASEYDTSRRLSIKSRWITASASARQTSSRYIALRGTTPVRIRFKLDAGRRFSIADPIDMLSRAIQGADGAPQATEMVITSLSDDVPGVTQNAWAESSLWSGRYAYIAPNIDPLTGSAFLDYSSETAQNKRKYGFICPNSGVFADGTEGYKIA